MNPLGRLLRMGRLGIIAFLALAIATECFIGLSDEMELLLKKRETQPESDAPTEKRPYAVGALCPECGEMIRVEVEGAPEDEDAVLKAKTKLAEAALEHGKKHESARAN